MEEEELKKTLQDGLEQLKATNFNYQVIQQLASRKTTRRVLLLSDERILVGSLVIALLLMIALLTGIAKAQPAGHHSYPDSYAVSVLILLFVSVPVFLVAFQIIGQKQTKQLKNN